jgi:hypothetical protein
VGLEHSTRDAAAGYAAEFEVGALDELLRAIESL